MGPGLSVLDEDFACSKPKGRAKEWSMRGEAQELEHLCFNFSVWWITEKAFCCAFLIGLRGSGLPLEVWLDPIPKTRKKAPEFWNPNVPETAYHLQMFPAYSEHLRQKGWKCFFSDWNAKLNLGSASSVSLLKYHITQPFLSSQSLSPHSQHPVQATSPTT